MDDMERLFDNAWGFQFDPFANFNLALPQLAEFEQGMWTPQIETFEQGGKFTLRADLPGMKLEDIDVQITDDALILSGERSEETEEEREGFYHSERNYGEHKCDIPERGTRG
jgi:HSP20 family protein